MRWDEIRPRLDAYIDGGVRLTTPRFSGRSSPRRYGRPLNWLPASRLLPRAAGWSAATLCFGTPQTRRPGTRVSDTWPSTDAVKMDAKPTRLTRTGPPPGDAERSRWVPPSKERLPTGSGIFGGHGRSLKPNFHLSVGSPSAGWDSLRVGAMRRALRHLSDG